MDRQVVGATLIAFTVRAAAQTTPCVRVINGQVWYPSMSFTRPNTRVIVNGNVVADSVPFVARTGDGFLASGPGEAFGITGYRCADCQMTRVPGQRPEDTFFAEPVVMSVTTATPVQAGDVIEAVNDRPITSSAGAEQFSYPPLGGNTLTVRRGRDRLVLHFEVASCTPRNDTTIAFTLKGRDSIPPVRILPLKPLERGTIRIRGRTRVPDSLAQPIYVIDGVLMEPVSSSPATGYGFAFSCGYGCVKVTNPDGTRFYRFPAAPKITAIRDDSPAAKAGLKVGDVVLKIDGVSILDYEGASRLADTEHKSSLHVTVLRESKEIDYVLQPPK